MHRCLNILLLLRFIFVQPIGSVAKDIDIGAVGPGFYFRAGQIGTMSPTARNRRGVSVLSRR